MRVSDRYRDRATALLDLGRHAEAVTQMRRAVALDPDDAFLLALLSWCLRVCGDYDEAVDTAEHAVGADPDLAFAHAARARALVDGGRSSTLALAASAQAVRLDPHASSSHYAAAVSHLAEGDHGSARYHATRVLELDPEPVWGLCLLAEVYRREHEWATARSLLERALGTNRHSAVVLRHLAALEGSAGDFTGSLEWSRRAAAERPQATSAFEVASSMLNHLNDELTQDGAVEALMHELGTNAEVPFVGAAMRAAAARERIFRQDDAAVASLDAIIATLEESASFDPDGDLDEPEVALTHDEDAVSPSAQELGRRFQLALWLGGPALRRREVDSWLMDAAHAHINRLTLGGGRADAERALELTDRVLGHDAATPMARARCRLIRAWAFTAGRLLPLAEASEAAVRELEDGLGIARRAGGTTAVAELRAALGGAMRFTDPTHGTTLDDAVHHLTDTLDWANRGGLENTIGVASGYLASAHYLRLLTRGSGADAQQVMVHLDARLDYLRAHHADESWLQAATRRALVCGVDPRLDDVARRARALETLAELDARVRTDATPVTRATLACTRAEVLLELAPALVPARQLLDAVAPLEASCRELPDRGGPARPRECRWLVARLLAAAAGRGRPTVGWEDHCLDVEQHTSAHGFIDMCLPDQVLHLLHASEVLRTVSGSTGDATTLELARDRARRARQMAAVRHYIRLEQLARAALDRL